MTDRFWAKVEETAECWLWTACTDPEGYGRFNVAGKPELAHRVAYERSVGPIPEGHDLDHLCRVRNCVRPDHLEPVTRGENLRRGMHPNFVTARVAVCARGHEQVGENVYARSNGRRMCRPCSIARSAARRAALIGPDVRRDPERGPHRIVVEIEDIEGAA